MEEFREDNQTRITTHIVIRDVDTGKVLLNKRPVEVKPLEIPQDEKKVANE